MSIQKLIKNCISRRISYIFHLFMLTLWSKHDFLDLFIHFLCKKKHTKMVQGYKIGTLSHIALKVSISKKIPLSIFIQVNLLLRSVSPPD